MLRVALWRSTGPSRCVAGWVRRRLTSAQASEGAGAAGASESGGSMRTEFRTHRFGGRYTLLTDMWLRNSLAIENLVPPTASEAAAAAPKAPETDDKTRGDATTAHEKNPLKIERFQVGRKAGFVETIAPGQIRDEHALRTTITEYFDTVEKLNDLTGRGMLDKTQLAQMARLPRWIRRAISNDKTDFELHQRLSYLISNVEFPLMVSSTQRLALMGELRMQMVRHGISPSRTQYHKFLNFYLRYGSEKVANLIQEEMRQAGMRVSIAFYTMKLSRLLHRRHFDAFDRVLETAMDDPTIDKDPRFYAVVAARHLASKNYAEFNRIVDMLGEEGRIPHWFVTVASKTLPDAAVREEGVIEAVLASMERYNVKPNDFVLGSVLRAAFLREDPDFAQTMVERMQAEHGVKMNVVLHTQLMKVYARCGWINKAAMEGEMLMSGRYELTEMAVQELMCLYSREGMIANAETLVSRVQNSLRAEGNRPGVAMPLRLMTSFMQMYVWQGMPDKALRVYDAVLEQGSKPDTVMQTQLLLALVNAHRFDDAERVIASIVRSTSERFARVKTLTPNDWDPNDFLYKNERKETFEPQLIRLMIQTYAAKGQCEKVRQLIPHLQTIGEEGSMPRQIGAAGLSIVALVGASKADSATTRLAIETIDELCIAATAMDPTLQSTRAFLVRAMYLSGREKALPVMSLRQCREIITGLSIVLSRTSARDERGLADGCFALQHELRPTVMRAVAQERIHWKIPDLVKEMIEISKQVDAEMMPQYKSGFMRILLNEARHPYAALELYRSVYDISYHNSAHPAYARHKARWPISPYFVANIKSAVHRILLKEGRIVPGSECADALTFVQSKLQLRLTYPTNYFSIAALFIDFGWKTNLRELHNRFSSAVQENVKDTDVLSDMYDKIDAKIQDVFRGADFSRPHCGFRGKHFPRPRPHF